MKISSFISFILSGLFLVSCITDDNRCDPGMRYVETVPEGGRRYYCEKIDEDEGDSDSTSESEADGGVASDSGTDDGTDDADDPYYGLGESCWAEFECADFNADFCATRPGYEGYCSIRDCTPSPNSCPQPYVCCESIMSGLPNFCVTDEDLETMTTVCAS